MVGLLFQEGKTNALMNRLPTFKAERGEAPYNDPIDYNDLITNRKDYFLYNGSLTTISDLVDGIPPKHSRKYGGVI